MAGPFGGVEAVAPALCSVCDANEVIAGVFVPAIDVRQSVTVSGEQQRCDPTKRPRLSFQHTEQQGIHGGEYECEDEQCGEESGVLEGLLIPALRLGEEIGEPGEVGRRDKDVRAEEEKQGKNAAEPVAFGGEL